MPDFTQDRTPSRTAKAVPSKNSTDVDRVIDGTSARICHVKTALFCAVRRDLDHPVGAPVPLIGTDGTQIGFASIYLEGGGLFADLFLSYSTPERLLIENGEKLYAVPRFAEMTVAGKPSHFEVEKITLYSTPVFPGTSAVGEDIL